MKHTHITILKEDFERFKTAVEINQGTSFLNSAALTLGNHVVCNIDYTTEQDIFYLGAKFERNENG